MTVLAMDGNGEKGTGRDEVEIVVARLRALPENALIAIGFGGTLSREKMIEEVVNGSEIGKDIVEMQMAYLRSFKER